MEKQIILLNGPSSSGKSTLSRNLQALIAKKRGERYGIASIDDFMKISTEETIYEDDVFEISGTLCEAVLDMLKNNSVTLEDDLSGENPNVRLLNQEAKEETT